MHCHIGILNTTEVEHVIHLVILAQESVNHMDRTRLEQGQFEETDDPFHDTFGWESFEQRNYELQRYRTRINA